MTARTASILLLLSLAAGLQACASSEQTRASQMEAETALADQDDAQCKSKGYAPATPGYEDCRKALAESRAANEASREQRKEAFQSTLGAGTDALADH